MIVTYQHLEKISECINAGLSIEETLEYTNLPDYFQVLVGTNDAGRDDFRPEYWEFWEAFTSLEEATKEAARWNGRVVDMNYNIIIREVI